ncbi:hypothetical protein [Acinetobacter sp. ANC 3832]|uniref:hypothetical protein n=1 Tax=Acinetobacter sp. ANC 3832 TaxID=1977874 RepID=UPI000A34F853|nr:hypothetical protein [Acinetobacter sp. ANC 3832]OTG94645.1 hypothetical protein B9T35_04495 [Acinetobacter sp. ANC 3832]
MGVQKYTVTLEADTPPQIFLGQNILGGKVVGLVIQEVPKLVSVSWLVERYNFTKTTIIKKLEGYNQGTEGKHLYDSKTAMVILSQPQKNKRGAKRVN